MRHDRRRQRPGRIAYADGSIWVANTGDGTITRIDADTDRPTKTLDDRRDRARGRRRHALGEPDDANQVARIDPATGDVQTIAVGNGPTGIAFGSGSVWVANSLDGTLSRIDPETNSVVAVTAGRQRPDGRRRRPRGVWVSNQFDGTLVRLDPRTNQVVGGSGREPAQGVAMSQRRGRW